MAEIKESNEDSSGAIGVAYMMGVMILAGSMISILAITLLSFAIFSAASALSNNLPSTTPPGLGFSNGGSDTPLVEPDFDAFEDFSDFGRDVPDVPPSNQGLDEDFCEELFHSGEFNRSDLVELGCE